MIVILTMLMIVDMVIQAEIGVNQYFFKCTIIISILTSIIIGAIASFIVWVIPAERFEPKIRLVSYNQKIEEDVIKDSKGKNIKRHVLKRNVHIVNTSSRFAAYNVTCFAELLDEDNNIVYHEEKKVPIVEADTSETEAVVLPFERLSVAKLMKKNVIKIEFHLVFENRYGTKKTSGPWWVKEYVINSGSFNTVIE